MVDPVMTARAVAHLDQQVAFLNEAADRAIAHGEDKHGGREILGGHVCPGDETLDALQHLENTGDNGGLFTLAMAAISEIAKYRKGESK